jgi:hypothetical protein
VLFDPLGEAAGGQGVPAELLPGLVCEVPESLPGVLDEPEVLDESVLGEPGFAPEFGFEAFGVPFGPGNGPQGAPFGVVPGLFWVFGFTVDGCVLPGELVLGTVPGVVFLGVVPLVELDPGVFGFCGDCGVAVPAGGVAVLGGGVAVPAGGVAVLAGGVAVPGVEL